MLIVYESKTGFTKKYAQMLASKTGLKAIHLPKLTKEEQNQKIIFLGWIKAGRIQGLSKIKKENLIAVCASGTAQSAEPSEEALKKNNKVEGVPFFYLIGGCLPINELKGTNKFLMRMFVKMLKLKKDKTQSIIEGINRIENGFNGVKEENLTPLINFLNNNK